MQSIIDQPVPTFLLVLICQKNPVLNFEQVVMLAGPIEVADKKHVEEVIKYTTFFHKLTYLVK
jgi:hypothetical protein